MINFKDKIRHYQHNQLTHLVNQWMCDLQERKQSVLKVENDKKYIIMLLILNLLYFKKFHYINYILFSMVQPM